MLSSYDIALSLSNVHNFAAATIQIFGSLLDKLHVSIIPLDFIYIFVAWSFFLFSLSDASVREIHAYVENTRKSIWHLQISWFVSVIAVFDASLSDLQTILSFERPLLNIHMRVEISISTRMD